MRPLAITAGEPAGIGPDLCLAIASQPRAEPIVVLADPDLLARRAAALGLSVALCPYVRGSAVPQEAGRLAVCAEPVRVPSAPGRLDVRNAPYVLALLERALAGCTDGEFAGMVTAPVHKGILCDAGVPFSGHTEYIAERTASEHPVMLLVAGELRVALATTHLPLRAVSDALTVDGLAATLAVLGRDLKRFFGLRPRIAVCGLNPHAGEGGHLGSEERTVLAPAIAEARAAGLEVSDPLPADTVFVPARLAQFDVVLAMYHDQGLPVLKHAGFGHAVNVTLGLPIVRTSVDHGTALELAGTGRADPGSLAAALALAGRMSRLRTER